MSSLVKIWNNFLLSNWVLFASFHSGFFVIFSKSYIVQIFPGIPGNEKSSNFPAIEIGNSRESNPTSKTFTCCSLPSQTSIDFIGTHWLSPTPLFLRVRKSVTQLHPNGQFLHIFGKVSELVFTVSEGMTRYQVNS